MVEPGDAVSHYSSKVGGAAWFPGADPLSPSSDVSCAVCGDPLALVVQAYAPLSVEQAGVCLPDRTMHLYGCVKEGCGKLQGSWRAFRAQLAPGAGGRGQGNAERRHPTTPSGGAATADGRDEGLDSGKSASFGLGGAGGDDRSGGKGDERTEDPFGFGDLNAALDDLTNGHKGSMNHKQENRIAKKAKGRSSADTNSAAAAAAGSSTQCEAASVSAAPTVMLPEFFLPAVPEPGPEHEGFGKMTEAERTHVDEILERYKETAQELEGGKEKKPERGENWAGEVHEKCSSRWSDGGAFWRFKKRLDRCPEQCVRYSFGGEFLNPSNDAIKVPSCSACGSQRHMELQIVPALIFSISEAASWCDGKEALVGSQAAAVWEWATVAVYTCSRSCGGQSGSVSYAEEVAQVCMED
ncbi:unnamed protein product [Ostreobium quekettii]|uniref:Programmed cell death protein 2 C-terminal domain-containing protein n=1 Tax=Ostreobium quekettii TaxID=121088 RepID=A0A8S1IRJ8_9CHLO|nr:unnamed protein product [Ostreobium quekettii]